MRPYFFKEPTPTQRARARAYQDRQRARDLAAKKAKEATFSRVIRKIREVFNFRKIDDIDRWYIQRAKEKRARRRARNLAWWANDQGWHRERLGV